VKPPGRGLLDTTIFIANESGRRLDETRLPAQSSVSVVTVAELQAGVLAAADTDTRARRLATLDSIADVQVHPIDVDAAAAWARLRVHLLDAGRRVNVNDLWIAASAVALALPLVTQDDDFDPLDGFEGLSIIRA